MKKYFHKNLSQLIKRSRNYFPILLLIIAISLIFLLFSHFWPDGTDYYFTFRPTTIAFFLGDTQLYDGNSVGFYNSPWTIFILYPTTLMPLKYGKSLILIISLIGLLLASFAVLDQKENRFNILIIILGVANLHTFDLLIRGNLDGLLVLGVGLGWLAIKHKKPFLLSIGFILLSIKPINVIFVFLVFIKSIWKWSIKEKIIACSPIALLIIMSFPVFGWDWIRRYFNSLRLNPPQLYLQTSLWRTLQIIGVQSKWRFLLFGIALVIFLIIIKKLNKVDEVILALALSLNLVFSPYVLGSHYVLLTPTFIILTKKNKLFLASWILSLTPLSRLIYGFDNTWIDIFYPILLLFGSTYYYLKEQRKIIKRPKTYDFRLG